MDLCAGHPKRTQQSRCITARYGQTTLSNHKAERSGALLIKEATRKGYQEAAPGDSVDLGYPGSTTRAGRVGAVSPMTPPVCRASWSAADASAA